MLHSLAIPSACSAPAAETIGQFVDVMNGLLGGGIRGGNPKPKEAEKVSSEMVHVGMDVHQGKLVWCAVNTDGEVVGRGAVEMRRRAIAQLARRWIERYGAVQSWYEAGPWGYWLHRLLEAEGISSAVIAPALTPRRPGDRVKTDRRDALELAVMGMRGMLTEVYVPDRRHEAVRELMRLRWSWRAEVRRLKTRITHFLNRQGVRYEGGKRWTKRHRQWLKRLRLGWIEQIVLEEMLEELERAEEALRRVEARLIGVVKKLRWWKLVELLQAIRGVGLWTALTVAIEAGDLRRFVSGEAFASWAGLVPGERSSGGKQRRGRITRRGNSLVRWALVDAGWVISRRLREAGAKARRRGAGEEIVRIAEAADERLHVKYWRLVVGRKKAPAVAVVATARELAEVIWRIGRLVEL